MIKKLDFSISREDFYSTTVKLGISKLNILPKINEYDIVGNFKCPTDLMHKIDKNIVKIYTGIDYREFEKFINELK